MKHFDPKRYPIASRWLQGKSLAQIEREIGHPVNSDNIPLKEFSGWISSGQADKDNGFGYRGQGETLDERSQREEREKKQYEVELSDEDVEAAFKKNQIVASNHAKKGDLVIFHSASKISSFEDYWSHRSKPEDAGVAIVRDEVVLPDDVYRRMADNSLDNFTSMSVKMDKDSANRIKYNGGFWIINKKSAKVLNDIHKWYDLPADEKGSVGSVVLVRNELNTRRALIDTEGHDYPRYVQPIWMG